MGITEDALRQLSRQTPVAEPEDNGHGCDGGFRYVNQEDGSIAVEPCPECVRERHLAKLEDRIRESGIGSRYFQVEAHDLETVEPFPRIVRAAERIGDIIRAGESALFHGTPGTGKTQAAVLLLKSAIRAGFTARLENLGRLGMEVRSGYDGPGLDEATVTRDLSAVDLLVLDDIGAGETQAAKIEQRILYFVTEARQNERRPTIVTTNLPPAEVAKAVGQRIINRLQPLAIIPFTHGQNFRKRDAGERGLW